MKTFYQIEAEGGKEMHHHWRLTCTGCGTVQTCRCSAPKTEADGLCFDCCERDGINFQTGEQESIQLETLWNPVVAGMTKTLWHLSNAKFKKFDPSLSGQGVIWFSDNMFDLVKGGHGASLGFGKPVYLYKCQVRVNKTAGREEYEKYGIGELIRDGYDSVELEGDWAILNSRNIRITHVQEVDRRGSGMTAAESKCREILPPEFFDFKQPCEPPVVFLGGAIDMGAAVDWQKEIVDYLKDVSCVALNPRRKDWDSSWEQKFENAQFREQVEWELKGLEQASLVLICLTKDSKAPISLLELGLHVVGNRMMVFCPEGFYRKGNIDVVCNRYGVPVFEDFEEFKMAVKDRLSKPRDIVGRTVQASDRVSRRIMAREFVEGMLMASKKVVCPECGKMTNCLLVPGGGSILHFMSHTDRKGGPCKGSGWEVPRHPDKEEFGARKASMQRHCSIYNTSKGWYLELADQEYGEVDDATVYGPFETSEKADEYLSEGFSNPGSIWFDRKKRPVPKNSPNGRPVITPRGNSRWGSEGGETHPWGSSPLSRRPDYGVRDGEVASNDNLRVKVVTNRIVASAREFLGEE